MSNDGWYDICKDCGLMFPTGGTHTCPARHFVGSIGVSDPPIVLSKDDKVEIFEPDYKRAYYILARLVAQAYENTEENPFAVEDYVKRAMEFVENMDNAPLTQKV